MKIVEAQEAREKLTMPVCMDLMRTALKELEEGNWTQPVRSIAVLPGGEKFGFMPAWLKDSYGAKVLVACPQNAGTAYPSHIGYVMMFDGAHGEVMGPDRRRIRSSYGSAGKKRRPPSGSDRRRSPGTFPSGSHDGGTGHPEGYRL